MRRISPRRRLPQLLRLLLFIGISSATPDAAANYTLGESYRAQSLSTSISSPWPPPSTRVRNIKGAVPAKTKSTGDVTSRRLLVLVADGDTSVTADGLEEIGKKSGLAGDFRDSRDFKADDAFRAPDLRSADFKADSSSFDRARTALFEVDAGTRKKRHDWYFAAVPNFWTYQPQGYSYYGFGIPVVLIQWPSALPMQRPHQVHSPNDSSRIKSRVDFNDLNHEDDKNFKGKKKFGDDYEEDDEHDEYDEHIHVDDERDYEEDDVVKNEEPNKIRTGLYSGGTKARPIFPSKKPDTVKKPLPTPKKRRPLEHWLQHVFPPWPKNRTVVSRN